MKLCSFLEPRLHLTGNWSGDCAISNRDQSTNIGNPVGPQQLLVQIIRCLPGGDSNDRLAIETAQGHMTVELGMIGTRSTGRKLLDTGSLRSPCPGTFPAGQTWMSPQQAFRPITTLLQQTNQSSYHPPPRTLFPATGADHCEITCQAIFC